MPRYDFTIKAGGTYPPFTVKVLNENNSAVSLSGAKNVYFSMRVAYPGTTVISDNVDGTMVDSVAGEFKHQWLQTDTSGFDNTEVIAEFLVSMADDTMLKVPTEGYFEGRIGEALT